MVDNGEFESVMQIMNVNDTTKTEPKSASCNNNNDPVWLTCLNIY